MTERNDSYRPEGVSLQDWDEYTRLLSHADHGVMQPDHLQRIWALREVYPQLESGVGREHAPRPALAK